jgi:hypothetical protein
MKARTIFGSTILSLALIGGISALGANPAAHAARFNPQPDPPGVAMQLDFNPQPDPPGFRQGSALIRPIYPPGPTIIGVLGSKKGTAGTCIIAVVHHPKAARGCIIAI